MSRNNQRVVLPQIQQQKGTENYNFITSKKKNVQFQQLDDGMEDWKKKCEDLQKDIEIRNQSIFSIQRNFESLSSLLKNEKSENAAIREEILRLREQSTSYNNSERESQQKINEQSKKIKELMQQLDMLQEDKKANTKLNQEIAMLKNKIIELEEIVQNKIFELQAKIAENYALQDDHIKCQQQLKEIFQLQTQIVQLSEQIQTNEKTISEKDFNLQLAFQNATQLTQLVEAQKKENLALQAQIKQIRSHESVLHNEIGVLTQKITDYQIQHQQQQDQLNNQQTLLLTRNQQDGQQNQQLKQMQHLLSESQKNGNATQKKLDEVQSHLNQYKDFIEQCELIHKQYGQINLVDSIKELYRIRKEFQISQDKQELYSQELLQNQQINQKMELEMKLLDKKHQESIKESEKQKSYIYQMEQELKLKSDLLKEGDKGNTLKQLNDQITLLNTNLQQSKNDFFVMKQIAEKYQEFDELINNYKKFKTTPIMIDSQEYSDLKQNVDNFNGANQLMLEEMEKKNAKIAELEKNTIVLQENRKQLQLSESLVTELKEKLSKLQQQITQMNKEMNTNNSLIDQLQDEITTTSKENRNLAQQLQETQENLFQNKSNMQSQQKEMKAALDAQYQLNNEIKTLTSKLKKTEEELELLNPDKLRELQKKLELKEKEFQSQLINIGHAQDAQITSITCNNCFELLKQAITCYPCGHSYCEGCYKQECIECKSSEGSFKNKQLDDLISKISYSNQILNTYKKQ